MTALPLLGTGLGVPREWGPLADLRGVRLEQHDLRLQLLEELAPPQLLHDLGGKGA